MRIYTINGPEFYEAFYQYNRDNPDPLPHPGPLGGRLARTLIWTPTTAASWTLCWRMPAGWWTSSTAGATSYDPTRGSGQYRRDVSPWVLGYILGVEWNDRTVAYTDSMEAGVAALRGEYFYASRRMPAL